MTEICIRELATLWMIASVLAFLYLPNQIKTEKSQQSSNMESEMGKESTST